MAPGVRALLPALLLAGCATVPDGAEEPYRALGTEPFWSIAIADGRMTYETPDGGFSLPAPRAEETGDGRIYRTRRITLHIWLAECSDGMSDRRYRDTVRAEVDGRTLDGCGGPHAEAGPLHEMSWLIVEIDGEATELTGDLLRDDRYAVDFGNERFMGYGGCNRFSATYTLVGRTLSAGPLMSTRRACPEPTMGRERRLFEILSAPVEMSLPDAGSMILENARGSVRLRRTG